VQVGAYARARPYATVVPGSAELHRRQLFCRRKNLFKKLAFLADFDFVWFALEQCDPKTRASEEVLKY
jgi:hypothetical protein